MPCRDYESGYGTQIVYREDKKRLDEFAARLCRVYTVLQKQGLEKLIPEQDRHWWDAHQEADRKAAQAKQDQLKKRREQLARELRDIDKQIR